MNDWPVVTVTAGRTSTVTSLTVVSLTEFACGSTCVATTLYVPSGRLVAPNARFSAQVPAPAFTDSCGLVPSVYVTPFTCTVSVPIWLGVYVPTIVGCAVVNDWPVVTVTAGRTSTVISFDVASVAELPPLSVWTTSTSYGPSGSVCAATARFSDQSPRPSTVSAASLRS